MGKNQFDYDPDFDDYETIQDQWLNEGKFSREGSSNVNRDDIIYAEESDKVVNPYGYQIVTPADYQTYSDASDNDKLNIGDDRNTDVEHFDFIAKVVFSDFKDGLAVAELDDLFSPEGLLEYWQSTWFRLTEAQQKSFLARHEVEVLCKWPKNDIKKIMESEKKLSIVLDQLNKRESIDADDYKKYKP
jgi:hypothetical protein